MGNILQFESCSSAAGTIYTLAAYGDKNGLKDAISADKFRIGIKYVDTDGRTPLMRATQSGHVDCVRLLINAAVRPTQL